MDPKKRELLVHLFLIHGRAYRMASRTIPGEGLGSHDLKSLMATGFVSKRGKGYVLTGFGRAMGYGLLEYHELNKRLKGSPGLKTTPDVPFPGEALVGGKVFVDIGCGSGAFVNSGVQAQAKLAFGIDPQAHLLKLARLMDGSGRTFFMNGRAEDLPLASGTGDVIFLRVVLPYVHNEATLAEVARVSAQGADLFITTLGPGYYLKAAIDAVKNLRILHLIYVLLVLLNGAIYYFFHMQISFYLKKYFFPELLSIFNTPGQLGRKLMALGFCIKDTKTRMELGIPSHIFFWAKKK